MAEQCIHCYISGKVQGVFYRDSTCKKAQELGITGWVKNLPDGRVELVACGEEKNVDALKNWLWQGPPAAKVDHVESETIEVTNFEDFRAR